MGRPKGATRKGGAEKRQKHLGYFSEKRNAILNEKEKTHTQKKKAWIDKINKKERRYRENSKQDND